MEMYLFFVPDDHIAPSVITSLVIIYSHSFSRFETVFFDEGILICTWEMFY